MSSPDLGSDTASEQDPPAGPTVPAEPAVHSAEDGAPRHAMPDPATEPRHAAAPTDDPTLVAAPRHSAEAEELPGPRRRPRTERSEPTTVRGHLLAFARELSIVVVGALVVSTLLRLFVAQMYDIPSPSMDQTLQVGDRVLVERISPVQRGQVVVFHDPGGWLRETSPERGTVGRAMEFVGLLPASSSDHVVKRAIGLPGDEVICCDAAGRITVNGYALEEPYVIGQQPSVIPFRVEVPADHLFVLGDNRVNSRDSRCHLNDPGMVMGAGAFVPTDDVVGRGVAVVWPRAHWQSLDPPPSYGGIPTGRNPARDHPVIEAGPEARC